MVQASLIPAAMLELAAAALFAYVGLHLWRRRTSGEASWAATMFSVWWFALAASTAGGAVSRLAGAAAYTDLAFHVTVTYLNLLLICVALAGLLYYLVYLFTGWQRALLPIAGFYVLYYFTILYYVTARQPVGVEVDRWNVSLQYAGPEGGLLFTILLLLLVLPQILGALAYFTVYFRVRDRTQRYRVALVSWSLIIWFSTALIGSAAGVSGLDWWQVTTRLIGLGAALTIYLAYEPPQWVQREYGITALREEVG